MFVAAPGAGPDHRWPDVAKLLARQDWRAVRAVLDKNGVDDPKTTLERLRRFTEMLVQWNRSVSNLISKNDEDRVVAAHLLASIEPVGWLKSQNLARWCDLGSGGGFPALPLAICGVGTSWDLVESRRTKTLFMRRAVGELGLGHVRIHAARIEDLLADLGMGGRPRAQAKDDDWGEGEGELEAYGDGDGDSEAGRRDADGGSGRVDREGSAGLEPPYDGFTSRATMSLPPTLTYAAPIVRPGGQAFLWKGSRLAAEASESDAWKANWEAGESRALAVEHSVVANFKRR